VQRSVALSPSHPAITGLIPSGAIRLDAGRTACKSPQYPVIPAPVQWSGRDYHFQP
jgi:hypothetical protein